MYIIMLRFGNLDAPVHYFVLKRSRQNSLNAIVVPQLSITYYIVIYNPFQILISLFHHQFLVLSLNFLKFKSFLTPKVPDRRTISLNVETMNCVLFPFSYFLNSPHFYPALSPFATSYWFPSQFTQTHLHSTPYPHTPIVSVISFTDRRDSQPFPPSTTHRLQSFSLLPYPQR